MSELLTARELSQSEQQVLLALKSLAEKDPKLPSMEEVQKEMRRLRLKTLGVTRIGQLIAALEKKQFILRTIAIVKKREAAA